MSLGDSDTAVNSSDRVTVQEETLYTYGDAEWGDLLTAYDGEEITYDGIGNPLSYRGWTMNWQGGRQLSSMTKGSDTLSFAYNESGLRTSKTVNGVTHNYVWQGSKLAADITDAYALYFHYDSSGEVIGFTRTASGADAEYFYVKNLQGDILKVITATGTEAATYTYDAWGMLLTSSGDMAEANPIRYRGYYYDNETGLYYLQSRYYDPEVGRFINLDSFASTGLGILGANMFVYCMNNAVFRIDKSGRAPLQSVLLTDSAPQGTMARLIARQLEAERAYEWLDTRVQEVDSPNKFTTSTQYLGIGCVAGIAKLSGNLVTDILSTLDVAGTILVVTAVGGVAGGVACVSTLVPVLLINMSSIGLDVVNIVSSCILTFSDGSYVIDTMSLKTGNPVVDFLLAQGWSIDTVSRKR